MVTAFGIKRSRSGYPHYIGVFRVNNSSNMMAFGQAHILPCFTAVDRFIDSIAIIGSTAVIVLTGSNPYYVRVVRIDSHIADTYYAVVIENRVKGDPVINCFP